jgi:hypothetical protein
MRCNKLISARELKKIWRKLVTTPVLGSFVLTLLLAACGGGGGGTPLLVGDSTSSTANNVQPISVAGGPGNGVNLLLTSVRICTPGSTSQCQTIDNILVDTGSYGLRVMASKVGSVAATSVISGNGRPLIECTQFADGFTWGAVKRVDIRIAGELAANIPIQVIDDSTPAVVPPTTCSSSGANHSTVASFGANGVLGVGVFPEDCGPFCSSVLTNNQYYDCLTGACSSASSVLAPLVSQVRNPIANFAVNNNGVVIDLPAVPDQGAAVASGSMIFGIGTQSNNGLGNARIIDLNPNSGTFTTTAPGQSFSLSFVDSGSNGLFFPTGAAFPASSLPTCSANSVAPEFFCPTSQLTFSATLNGATNGNNVAVNFNIGNAVNLLTNNVSFHAYNNLGAPIPPSLSTSFDWGLPFYLGRRVYTGLQSSATPTPYIAF